jgi:hypothetical protein
MRARWHSGDERGIRVDYWSLWWASLLLFLAGLAAAAGSYWY